MSSSSKSKNPFDFDVSAYPPLPAARGLFVTGTDTEVGKTLVAGAIARYLRRSGVAVDVFKPVASACKRSAGNLVSEDAEFLAACADSDMLLDEITPVRYALPLAPNVAADRENRPVDLDAIFRGYGRIVAGGRPVIVEGVGGLLCPITDDFWMIHLAAMMKLPVVIVARSSLGTINHTLLTLHAARSAGLTVAGVVMNRCEPGSTGEDPSVMTNPTQISERGQVKVLALVPDEKANSVKKATIGPDTTYAVGQVAWERIIGIKK